MSSSIEIIIGTATCISISSATATRIAIIIGTSTSITILTNSIIPTSGTYKR